MFNTEMILSTFIYTNVLFILFIYSLYKLITNKEKLYKKHYSRFVLLMLSGIVYNIIEGILPDTNFNIDILSQNTIAWTIGVLISLYYVYYIYKEYNLVFFKKLNIDSFLIIFIISFIFLFIFPYTIFKELIIPRYLFGFYALILFLIIFFFNKKRIIYSIHNNEISFINGFLALFFLFLTLIIIVSIGDNQFIEQTTYSIGFFILSIDFLFFKNIEKDALLKKDFNLRELLTNREKEITQMIKDNPYIKYKEIANTLNISESAVTAHMSRVFKKKDIKGKKEYIKKYT